MEVQSELAQRAISQGWRIITASEWERLCGWALSGDGTFFYQDATNKGYATPYTGEKAWADLCDIAMIEEK